MTNNIINKKNYRKNLAKKLNENRNKIRIPIIQKSAKELAKDLLMQEKSTENYKNSKKFKYLHLLSDSIETKLTKKLNQEIAIQLIAYGFGEDVVKYLDKFYILDYKNLANALILYNSGYELITNLEKFSGLTSKEIAMLFINHKKGDFLVRNLNNVNLQGLDSKEIAMLLVQNGQGRVVVTYPDNFHDLDEDTIEKSIKSFEKRQEAFKSSQVRQNFQNDQHRRNAVLIKEREKIKEKEDAALRKYLTRILLISGG